MLSDVGGPASMFIWVLYLVMGCRCMCLDESAEYHVPDFTEIISKSGLHLTSITLQR